MIIDHGRQQRMGRCDRMKVPCEMQVHIFHGNNLCVSAPSRTAFHPEVGPKRGFTNADHRLLADPVQTIAQTHGCGCLTLTGRGRIDRGDKDQLAVLIALNRVDVGLADLGFVVAVGQKMFAGTQLRRSAHHRFREVRQ